jgi:hypothetical protein
MRKLLLATTALLALAGAARADVVLTDKLSGTGDNVIFDSINGGLAVGTFNGQHQGFVDFTDLSGNPLFTGAQNGNDIKISNTNDLQVQVFNTDSTPLGTTTQVFSLKGTGDVIASMFAVDQFGNPEAAQVFDLGTIDPNAQSGFTFTTINGEVMTRMVLLDIGGMINDYEHYRIDAAPIPTAAVPELSTWAMMLLGFASVGLFGLRRREPFRFA